MPRDHAEGVALSDEQLEMIGDASRLFLDQLSDEKGSVSSLDTAERTRLLARYKSDPDFKRAVRTLAESSRATILDDRRGEIIVGIDDMRSPFAAAPSEFRVRTRTHQSERTTTVQLVVHVAIAATFFPMASVSQACPTYAFTEEHIRKRIVRAVEAARKPSGERPDDDMAAAVVKGFDEIGTSEKATRTSNLEGIVASALRGYVKLKWLREIARSDGGVEYQALPIYHERVRRLVAKDLYRVFAASSELDSIPDSPDRSDRP